MFILRILGGFLSTVLSIYLILSFLVKKNKSEREIKERTKFTVGVLGDVDFRNVSEALFMVPEGSTIIVKPGCYLVSDVKLSKSVAIIGEGKLGDVIFYSIGTNCLFMATDSARLSNVVVNYQGNNVVFFVPQGRLFLDDCHIKLQPHSSVGVAVGGKGAFCEMKNCWVENGLTGIAVCEGAAVRIKECNINTDGYSVIVAGENGKLHASDSRLHGNEGIIVIPPAHVEIERCEYPDFKDSVALVQET